GNPGLGKTYFSNEAAKALGLDYSEVNMATITAGFVLSGGSLQWGEGSIGFIAKSLADSNIGNPIVVLDEIDKAAKDSKYDPLGCFYPLLERHSALRFKDEALELELDTSYINWILTANNLQLIPAPILSRVKVFNIELPTTDQMPAIVKSIYAGIRESEPYGKLLDENLPDEILYMFDGVSPRVIKRKLAEACSKSFLDNRTIIRVSDFDLNKPKLGREYRIGFL
ncbi:MAG: AAA family ATPase, partial [Methylotenera sp.]